MFPWRAFGTGPARGFGPGSLPAAGKCNATEATNENAPVQETRAQARCGFGALRQGSGQAGYFLASLRAGAAFAAFFRSAGLGAVELVVMSHETPCSKSLRAVSKLDSALPAAWAWDSSHSRASDRSCVFFM